MEYLKKGNKLHLIALIFLTTLIGACSTLGNQKFELPPYKEGESSLIGLRVTASPPISIFNFSAHTAYFVKISDLGEPDLSVLYASTVSKNNNIYLFDFEPGRYALAASISQGGNGVTAIHTLSLDSVPETTFEVINGEFSYLGTYYVVVYDPETSSSSNKRDDFTKTVRMLLKDKKVFNKHRNNSATNNNIGGRGLNFRVTGVNYKSSLKNIDLDSNKFNRSIGSFFDNTDWKLFLNSVIK